MTCDRVSVMTIRAGAVRITALIRGAAGSVIPDAIARHLRLPVVPNAQVVAIVTAHIATVGAAAIFIAAPLGASFSAIVFLPADRGLAKSRAS